MMRKRPLTIIWPPFSAKRLAFIGLIVWLVGCGQATTPTAVVGTAATVTATAVAATITPSPTPTSTATPTATATPTTTPTPTFTPTPTAPPIQISGNPRALALATPAPQGNAPCGIVDVFDFPLDPPDAIDISRGGQDFGTYRSRYSKYHAGEDWWLSSGSSLGEPVYSIGHGIVTYAEPLGWGRDQGVVIVRHTFDDGRSILSFYGHLDPPSITLNTGDCVARGDQVGEIGKPKTPPHLHFEIREHMAFEPGPGYWFEDPTKAGWRPPSQTIWQQRLAAAPGLVWLRPFTDSATQLVDLVDDILLIVESETLIGINTANGTLSWTLPTEMDVNTARLDANQSILYAANRQGDLAAFNLPTADLPTNELWSTRLDLIGGSTLLPLPDGGVIVYVRRDATAVAPDGTILWSQDDLGQLSDWLLTEDGLLLVTAGTDTAMWLADENGITPLPIDLRGSVINRNGKILLYSREGLYDIDTTTGTATLLQTLSRGFIWMGDVAVGDDDHFLLAHADTFDRRLLAFNPDGTLHWERSYDDEIDGEVRPFVSNGRFYLLAIIGNGSTSEINIYSVDWDTAQLTKLFSGGTRSANTDANWLQPLSEGTIILNIGGGHMLSFDLINQ